MNYRSLLTPLAKSMRRCPTDAEKKLWTQLRKHQLRGLRFRRQMPIGSYIVDFCCLEPKLVIEVDGGQHDRQAQEDDVRTRFLQRSGYRVLRFWNNEVLQSLDGVMMRIDDATVALQERDGDPRKGRTKLGGFA
jgi:very-short-patch-repair endonuclease